MQLQTLTRQYDVEVLEHLDQQVEIPVLTGKPQAQGDVLVRPVAEAEASTLVPARGVPVVRGESNGNTHLLVAEGDVRFDANPRFGVDDLVRGSLIVEPGATAYLLHPEHGGAGIGEGCYEIRGQVEYADFIRIVAD